MSGACFQPVVRLAADLTAIGAFGFRRGFGAASHAAGRAGGVASIADAVGLGAAIDFLDQIGMEIASAYCTA